MVWNLEIQQQLLTTFHLLLHSNHLFKWVLQKQISCTDFFNEKISDKCKDYPLNEYDNELNKCSAGLIDSSQPSGSIPENFINDYINKVIQICTERENLENTFTNPDSIRYFT